jgi:hypothetical protein
MAIPFNVYRLDDWYIQAKRGDAQEAFRPDFITMRTPNLEILRCHVGRGQERRFCPWRTLTRRIGFKQAAKQ